MKVIVAKASSLSRRKATVRLPWLSGVLGCTSITM